MSNSVNQIMNGVSNAALANSSGSAVTPQQAGRTRTPVLFLIDVSGSTGEGDNPDLPQMQKILNQMILVMSQPPSTNPLASAATTVDVAIVSYSTEPTLVQPWEQANKLPALPDLQPLYGTNTATALIAALDYIGRRQDYYDKYQPQPIPKNIPHIFHFTDGAPTDCETGDALWLHVRELLAEVCGDKDKPFSMISHFIAPNGMTKEHSPHMKDAGGNQISGYEAMSQWFGGDTVYEMVDAPHKVDEIVKVVLKSVGGYSNQKRRINDSLKQFNSPVIRNPWSVLGQAPPKKTGTGR
jgi:uncharacterized protein YegL